jgi:hypothetical protein
MTAGYGKSNTSVPGAPTGVSGSATSSSAISVSFSAPGCTGHLAIDYYQAISSPGCFTATAASSPISVTGLCASTSYTFRVRAHNSKGYGSYSSSSGSITTCAANGSVTYSTPGTYTWTAPAGVSHVSVVAIGGGGGGTSFQGGGGGGLGWKNNISTTPGTGYQVVVGCGGARTYNQILCPTNGVLCRAYSVSAPSGTSSSFNGSTVVGGGGTGGYFAAGAIRPGGSYTGDGGGSGGNGGRSSIIGGGGAGGYTGRGGHAYQGIRPNTGPYLGGCQNFCGGGGQSGTSLTVQFGNYIVGTAGGGTGVGVGKNLSWSSTINSYQHGSFGPAVNGGMPGSKGQHGGYGGAFGNIYSGACYNGSCAFYYCASTNIGSGWRNQMTGYYACYYATCGGAYGGGGGTSYTSYVAYYYWGRCSYNGGPLSAPYCAPGGKGGGGVVRILWNGNSRSYPCTSTGTP